MSTRDISVIERALANPAVREALGFALSHRSEEIHTLFEPAFRRFFEDRLGDRIDVSSLSGEERLVLASYAKLAHGWWFKLHPRMLRETRGKAHLKRSWERIVGGRRLSLLQERSADDRVSMCRRRFSLDSVFGHPLDRIASGMPFDRADTLLLRERGDDCSPLFFVDDSGAPARLGVPEQGERVAYFSPVRSFIGPSVSLEDMLPNAFDHIIMEERVARFDISPHPGYYRRTETDGSLSEAELYPGCKIRVDGPTLREDAIVRAALDRSRAERIFETRFERLMMDRKASFVTESEYDKRLRWALRAFDRRFPWGDSLRFGAERRDVSIFTLIRSLAMTFPWHVRRVWQEMMPRLVAMSWGAVLDRRPPLDGVTARDDENSWQLPKAVADTVLDIRAFDFGGQSRRAFAFASDGGWLVMDFDREAYVPLAAYLRSADAYSIETHETSRTMPGCLVD